MNGYKLVSCILLLLFVLMQWVSGASKDRTKHTGYNKKIIWRGGQDNLVQEISIPPQTTAQSHHHAVLTEVFYFLTDHGYRIVNEQHIHPQQGDVLVIEPGDKHTVVNETDDDYRYLVFKINHVDNDIHWE